MEGFYLRTLRYYRPDYSQLMFLVWEITFIVFFFILVFLFFFIFWSVQALELKLRITLSLSCFSLLHFNRLLLFLLLCFARKISVFHFYWHPLSSQIHLRVCFQGWGFISIPSRHFKGNDFSIPRSIVLIIDSKEDTQAGISRDESVVFQSRWGLKIIHHKNCE